MSATDRVHVTTVVRVPPDVAFTAFTEEVDAWWRHGRRFRYSADPASTMRFEPGEGGRLVEVLDASGATRTHGRVLVWKVAERIAWEIDDPQFGVPIQVEVRFEPDAAGTRVSVIQSGFDRLAPDAPARHGLQGEAFLSMMGLWWADLLKAHQRRCHDRETGTLG